jgi:putative transposase
MEISRPNHVFAADITYIPMKRGFVYLFAVMDWASRRVLAWRLSNTLTTDFCIEAVQEAIQRYGNPDIFNTDQGSQFTSLEFTQLLTENGIAISMDGRGCWRDNVFVERSNMKRSTCMPTRQSAPPAADRLLQHPAAPQLA